MPANVRKGDILGVRTRLDVDPTEVRESDVGLGQQIGAALAMENITTNIGMRTGAFPPLSEESFAAQIREETALDAAARNPDPTFDPRDHLQPGEELIASQFAGMRSQAEMQALRDKIDREEEWRRMMGEGPLPELLASTISVLADPTTYLGLGMGVATRGVTVARAAARIGGVVAAETAAAEAALQAMQETRTIEESIAAVLLGGAFGATAGGVGKALAGRAAREPIDPALMEQAVQDSATVMRSEFGGGTVGAAEIRRIDPQDTELASSLGVAEQLRKLRRIGLAAPSLEGLSSPIAKAREMTLRLVDTGLTTKGAMRGVADPQALQTKIKRHEAVQVDFNQQLKAAFDEHRAAGGKLKQSEFYEAAGEAAFRGDQSAIPGAATAAKVWRTVADLYKNRAVSEGLLPEDVTPQTAKSYFSRVYKRAEIRRRRPEFKARIEKYLRRTIDADEIQADAEYGEIAEGIIDEIMGSPSGRTLQQNVPQARGPLKERTFMIPDEDIKDFLELDVQKVGNRYIKTMAADIETQSAFGTLDPGRAFKEDIRSETNKLIENAPNEKARQKIAREGERMESMLEGLFNNVRGVQLEAQDPSSKFGRATLGALRNLNFMRMLGGVTISSIPDMARLVVTEGAARTFGTILGDAMRGFKGIRMAGREAQRMGTALDILNSSRVKNVFDLTDRYEADTAMEAFEDMTGEFSNLASRVFLINRWNTAMKSISSSMVSTRILETSKKLAAGQKVSQADMRRLAQSGIGQEMAERIARQEEHWEAIGEGRGNIILGTSDAWTDREAADVFKNAVLRDVDNTIITPGAGDAPIWTSSAVGKSLFQFKKFGMASTQRILVSGLQNRDKSTMSGIAMMIGLGAMTVAMRDYMANGEVKERGAREWVAEGLDRSGVLSLFFEGDSLIEKSAGISPITALAGGQQSRFAGRGFLEQLGGPTAGAAVDFGRAVQGVIKGELTQSDLHKVRRLAPLQNTFYLRWMFDEIEKQTAQAFGLPEKARRRRKSTTSGVAPDLPPG